MKIAVIGGGASGMMAAVAAAKKGAVVTLFEANDRVGKKILSTGNGKCNFTNMEMDRTHYYSDDMNKVGAVLENFGALETLAFFEKAGMISKEKNGYVYPYSEQAQTVLDTFRILLKQNDIRLYTGEKITRVLAEKNGTFQVYAGEKSYSFDKVIFACGGNAAPKTGSDGNGYALLRKLGHSIVPTVPALVQLRCKEDFMKSIAGVRAECEIKLDIAGDLAGTEKGELQLTDYGISGIVVFQLSRLAAYALKDGKPVRAHIDFLPTYDEKTLYQIWCKKAARIPKDATAEEYFTGLLNKKLMTLFMKFNQVRPENDIRDISEKQLRGILKLVKNFTLHINGTNSFEQAQVTAGGVPLSEVSEHLESKLIKGCYIVGELLNVDGKCGGYNLQWAWSTGYLAGSHAVGGHVIGIDV